MIDPKNGRKDKILLIYKNGDCFSTIVYGAQNVSPAPHKNYDYRMQYAVLGS
jgi:hypothetical protein